MPLTETVRAALVDRQGPLGVLLSHVITYERGTVHPASPASPDDFVNSYVNALAGSASSRATSSAAELSRSRPAIAASHGTTRPQPWRRVVGASGARPAGRATGSPRRTASARRRPGRLSRGAGEGAAQLVGGGGRLGVRLDERAGQFGCGRSARRARRRSRRSAAGRGRRVRSTSASRIASLSRQLGRAAAPSASGRRCRSSTACRW